MKRKINEHVYRSNAVIAYSGAQKIMNDIEGMFGQAINEIERMLNTKTVVGDPITVDGNTLIPLISVGFGFGVGAGIPKKALLPRCSTKSRTWPASSHRPSLRPVEPVPG